MAQYRVLEIDRSFFPQKKFLFWWYDFTGNCYEYSYSISYATLQEAYTFIDSVIKKKPEKIIHNYPPEN